MGIRWGIQYSLVNTVWGTASTGSYGGTVFPGVIHYSLVNNVCGVRYSLGYRIHSDTGPFQICFLMACCREHQERTESLLPLWSIGVFQGDLSPLSCHSVLKTCVFLLYESENWILTDGLMAKL